MASQLGISITDYESCPKCGRSFKGAEIPRAYRKAYGGHTHYSLKVAIYDRAKDRTVRWGCPFCRHEWERE